MAKKTLLSFGLILLFTALALGQNVKVINDFETQMDNWRAPTYSGTTNTPATAELSADYAHSGSQSAKLVVTNDEDPANGWLIRWAAMRTDYPAADSRIGFWVRGANEHVKVRIVVLDDDGYEASQWHTISADSNDWQWVEIDLAHDPVYGWITGNSEINAAGGTVTIANLQIACDVEEDATLYFDDIIEIPYVPAKVLNDFETDLGNWKQPNFSGSTTVDPSSSLEVSADFAYTGVSSAKMTLINDDTPATGWFVRDNNRVDKIAPDSKISLKLRGTRALEDSFFVRLVIWDNGAGGVGYETTHWALVSEDTTDWQVVSFDLARAPVYGWVNGDNIINSTDFVTIESIQLQTNAEKDLTVYIDDIIEIPSVTPIPGLVINEIMQNPNAVSDTYGEWFEIYNPETYDVDINGWTIMDLDSDSVGIDNGGPLVIPAGGYLVLGRNDTVAVNGGYQCDYVYSDYFLANTADEILLVNPDGLVIDSVAYDGATWPVLAGASMELFSPDLDNSLAENWHVATLPYGDGDLGTPGAANGPPPNRTPVADAGADQTVAVGDSVTISGAASVDEDGDSLRFDWSVVSAPVAITLDDTAAIEFSFVAEAEGDYVFELIVNDGVLFSEPDTVTVIAKRISLVEEWWAEAAGSNFRDMGLDPRSGKTFYGESTTRTVYYYHWHNDTGTPNGGITTTLWATDVIVPYGVATANDGCVYIASWTTWSAGAIYKAKPDYKTVTKIADISTAGVRGLSVAGGGLDTKLHFVDNNGQAYEVTTSDMISWTQTQLFKVQNYNQVMVGKDDGTTFYASGIGAGPILKLDRAGNADAAFAAPPDITDANGLNLNEDETVLYAAFGGTDGAWLAKIDAATGAELAPRLAIGPRGVTRTVRGLDVVGNKVLYSLSGTPSYRGMVTDLDAPVPDNRKPWADAGSDQKEIRAGSLATLDGSGSADLDYDELNYTWTQVAGPEMVALTDAATAAPSFTPTVDGDFAFELVVNDGTLNSDPDTVTINVIPASNDLFIIFEDTLDIDNWGVFSLRNRYSSAQWGQTEGVGDSGALRVTDSGWGFAIERKVKATVGTPYKLTMDVKVFGVDRPLYARVMGLALDSTAVEIQNFSDDFHTIELTGFALNENGAIQILGETGGGADTVWIDNLIYDDNAPLPTYTVSGTVALSDAPEDLSGTEVMVVQTGFKDSTEADGTYSIGGLIAGTYDLEASHEFYKTETAKAVAVTKDTTVDFTLLRNAAPVADAGEDLTGVDAGMYVYLDGTGCSDPDGDSLRFQWTLVAFAGDTVIFENEKTATPGFRPEVVGEYVFSLVVNDGTELSNPDTVKVDVATEMPAGPPFALYDDFLRVGYGSMPHGIAVDPDGKIWVGWYGGTPGMHVFNPDKTPVSFSPIKMGVIGEDSIAIGGSCRGIEAGPDGNIYFATSAGGGTGIFKFDYKTGEPLGGIKRASSPTKPSVDANGNIYIGNVAFTGVDIYDANFDSVGHIDGSEAAGLPKAVLSRSVEVVPDGSRLFVADLEHGGRIFMFEGSIASGYVYVGDLPGPMTVTASVDLDPFGRLWVGDHSTDLQHVYSADLKYRWTLPGKVDGPRGVGFDPGGQIVYIIGFDGHQVTRWTTPEAMILTSLKDVAADVDSSGVAVLLDSVVTVKGYVTVKNEFGSRGPAFIQTMDGMYGCAVYDQAFVDSVSRGDEVMFTGKVIHYRGLTEFQDLTSVKVLSKGNSIEPLLITCADLADTLGEAYEGVLVKLLKAKVNAEEYTANSTLSIGDQTGSAVLYVDKDVNYAGFNVYGDSIQIVGVVSQYDAEAPYYQGYQIMPRDKDDVSIPVGVAEGDDAKLPTVFALHQNYPNPFNPTTIIRYDLPKACDVKIVIYNALGQQVKTLINVRQEAGYKQLRWDGRNDQGILISSGSYFYLIKAGDFQETKKMMFVK
ncbi:lamin tail domain-containing protein [candidate division KSB1 bacterium]|nr:lamin tail domain-containing protein [candidate division KSB1 bacterium]